MTETVDIEIYAKEKEEVVKNIDKQDVKITKEKVKKDHKEQLVPKMMVI